MANDFIFYSSLEAASIHELEHLLFFNPRQVRVRSKIIESVRRFGSPKIIPAGSDRIGLEMDGFPGAQSLFVLNHRDGAEKELCGLVVYVREAHDTAMVIHMAVAEAYSLFGEFASDMLLMRMLDELRAACRRIKGIRHISIMYGTGQKQELAV